MSSEYCRGPPDPGNNARLFYLDQLPNDNAPMLRADPSADRIAGTVLSYLKSSGMSAQPSGTCAPAELPSAPPRLE